MSIARLAETAKRTTSGASRPGTGLRREAEPAAESQFACPACGDGSEIPGTCPRCDVAMRPRTGVVYFGEVQTRTDRAAPVMTGVSWAVGVGLVLPAVAMMMYGRFLGMGNSVHPFDPMGRFNWQALPPLVFLGLAALIWLTVFGVRRARHAIGALRRASRHRTARRRLAGARSGEQAGAAHIVGRIRVEDSEAYVVSESARVRLPQDASVAVFRKTSETTYLVNGDEVEVVAHSRASHADAYRTSPEDSRLDARRPIEVWLR